MGIDKKREIVGVLMNKGILLDRDMLTKINNIPDPGAFHNFLLAESMNGELGPIDDIINRYKQEALVKRDTVETKPTENVVEKSVSDGEPAIDIEPGTVEVTFTYQAEPKKRDVQDFISLFTARYNAIRAMLRNRKELSNLTSINRLNQKKSREKIALIGLVTDKQVTKTGKIVMTLEDPTGVIKCIVSDTSDGFDMAKETSFDEVLGVVGTTAGEIIFVSNLVQPDIPLFKELKKSPDETNAIFIGDFHYGSDLFLYEAFDKFLVWLSAKQGSEAQKEVARKVKYVFILGDLVEGVGIYPNQEEDLHVKDIYEQYSKFAEYLKRIPSHIKIIICPGNHDAMRIAEPQPPLYKDFAAAVWELPNVVMVSNPAYVNIHKSDKFPGFDVLMYHGFSFTHYADSVESIRSQGGQARSDLIMKYVLQRRHLAPAHKSTLYLPDRDKDSLVIDKIPDIFATGHIHRVAASSYRNVTMLNCSCWIEKSDFQEKLGIEPDPGRALLVNLQTRKVKILKFYDGKKEEKTEGEE